MIKPGEFFLRQLTSPFLSKLLKRALRLSCPCRPARVFVERQNVVPVRVRAGGGALTRTSEVTPLDCRRPCSRRLFGDGGCGDALGIGLRGRG